MLDNIQTKDILGIEPIAEAETRTIPFTIGKRRDTRQEFGDMLNAMHQAAIDRDEPELTLEEINAEIAAVRAERKAR